MATEALSPAEALTDLTRVWRDDPVRFVRESYTADPEGEPVQVDPTQERILRALAAHDRVAVRSSHGIGKTTTAAWATQWWLATRNPALVVTLAGTWNHLEDKLWPEIRVWGRTWLLRDAFEWLDLEIKGYANPKGWRAKASSSDKHENIEGWHNPNLLVIIDEAKALPNEVYAGIRGALTQQSKDGRKPKMLVLSTPPLTKAGWYVDLFGAKSQGWETIHISGLDSPRVSREWIADMAQDFGEDSPIYQSKVLGEIPEGAAEAVVQIRWIEEAQRRGPTPERRGTAISCDVARQGEDLTTLGRIKDRAFKITKWKAKNDLTEVAGMCGTAAVEQDAEILVLDDTGVGGGVTDILRERQRNGTFPKKCRILPIQFGASAERDDRFHSAKDEMWWAAREALRNGMALPTDNELAALALPRGSDLKAQLASPIYEEDSQSRIHVLDKRIDNREKTRALPTKSPDLAHALILCVWGWQKLRVNTEPLPPESTQEAFNRRIQEAIHRGRTGGRVVSGYDRRGR